jgi:hypothetical protein
MRFPFIFAGLSLLVAAAACGGSGADGTGGSTSTSTTSTTSSTSGALCYNVPVNTGNGAAACGPNMCSGGTYCLGAGICDPGCLSEKQCPQNQTCDLSNPTNGPQGPVGLCRAPNSSETVACSSTSTSTSSGAPDCQPRCVAKAATCGAPGDVATQKCKELCATATPDQVTCLEGKSCADLGDAFQHGTLICGL